MASVKAEDAQSHACPFRDFRSCLGSTCMAWAWDGAAQEHRETSNLVETPEGVRPVGDVPAPEGEGWEKDGPAYAKSYHRSNQDKLPKASAQRWVRKPPQVTGRCARFHAADYPR